MIEAARKGIEAYEVYTGDEITVGVTHQIEIGRDKSWVKYEAKTKVRPGESGDDARGRAIAHVNNSVMDAVHRTVETVRSQQ